jgi:hypothetical protein
MDWVLCEKGAPARPASHDDGAGRGKRIVLIVDKTHLKFKVGEAGKNDVVGQYLSDGIRCVADGTDARNARFPPAYFSTPAAPARAGSRVSSRPFCGLALEPPLNR